MSFLGGHLPKSSSDGSSLVQLLASNSNGTILPFLRPKPQLPRPQSFNLNPLLETIATASARRYVISSGSKPEKSAWEKRDEPFADEHVEIDLIDGAKMFVLTFVFR